MNAIYKTLFEVKLMHEYFLTDKDGNQPFGLATPQARQDFVNQRFAENRESLHRDIDFHFPLGLADLYNGLQLKLVTVYGGFRIVARVKEARRQNNSLGFKPFLPLPDNLNIYVSITMKNRTFDDYTNGRIHPPLFASYLFSNIDLGNGSRQFPYLAAGLSEYDSGYSYEQGELAAYGPNDIRQFYAGDGGDEWIPVTGSAFANENDRMATAPSLSYFFRNQANLTSAVFTLKDHNGQVINTFSANDPLGITNTRLQLPAATEPSVTGSLANEILTLSVTGNNGYQAEHRLLGRTWLNAADWGVVHIATKSSITDFDIVDADGFLKDPFPAFEIPVKSRLAFWRYNNNRNKAIQLTAAAADYFRTDGNALISLKPYPVSQSQVFLSNQTNTDMKYFPNPRYYALDTDGNNRVVYTIVVPHSDLFPEV